MSENTFCTSCGTALVAGAAFCASCGTSTVATATPVATPAAAPAPQPVYAAPYAAAPQASYGAKSKVTAVWLSVLFGCFGFLYTYKVDKVRFWLYAIFSVVNLFIGLALYVNWVFSVVAIVYAATRSRDWYANYPNAR